MLNTRLSYFLSKAVLLSLCASAVSFGAVLYDSGTISLPFSSPIQHGRLSRSGVISDWSIQKEFPGAISPAISYGYESFDLSMSPFPYLQISFYDAVNAGNLFASAYMNSYQPTGSGINLGLDTNYLGDAGTSGNQFGNPAPFQVILPNVSTSHLVVVVNDSSITGVGGLGQPFQLLVEGFYDTNFNDTTPSVPEPASMALSGIGLLAAGMSVLLRKKAV